MDLFENLQMIKESKPIASLPISNTVSLNVYDIRHSVNDEILVGYDENNAEWVEINYTDGDAHPYFMFNGERHSTDFFTKNESKETLIERNELSVSEYNKLKIALNKNNNMKANFILHPGKVEANDYKMRISIYGAFRSFEKTKKAFYTYSSNNELTNDQVTKEGVGALLYYVYINLIDESIKFNNIGYNYELDRYLSNYEKRLISDDSLKHGELDLENLKASILEVAEKSKNDLEQVLLSKNFIYNLSGKRKTKNADSPEYNLDLENANLEDEILKEDFDPSMPNWLMKAIKMKNSNSGGHKDLNYTMAFDTMKWQVEPFPEKGKINNIGDNEYIALLIDKSGDLHEGNYVVYFPAAYIGNDETIMINGRNRRIDSMSLRALAPYVKEYAHTVNSNDSFIGVRNKQKDRGVAKDGSIDRINDNGWRYGYADKIDKSGYIVDPNKYKRLLAQMKSDEYAERLEDVYIVLSDLKTKLTAYASQDEMIPDAKEDRFKSRTVSVNKFTKGFKYYEEAIRNYQYATEELDSISKGEKGRWGSEAVHTFTKYLADAEVNITNCLDIIETE